MRLLLDTHAFLWWLDGDRRLPARVRTLVGDPANEVLVSESQGFVPLPITVHHAQRAGHWPDRIAIPSTGC